MGTVIAVLIFIICILLCIVILVQESKGGGLSSSFGSSNQVMGVRKTADFLEKATWTLAIALLSFSLLSAAVNTGTSNNVERQESEIRDLIEAAPVTPPAGMQNENIPVPADQQLPTTNKKTPVEPEEE